MKSKASKISGLMAILFFTYGITYLNFENLSFSANTKPYIVLILGLISIGIWFRVKSDES